MELTEVQWISVVALAFVLRLGRLQPVVLRWLGQE